MATTDTMRMKAILVLAGAVAFASAPFWTSGFGGFDPNRYPIPQIDPPVQPAGYAFSIWGVIYLWLIAHAGYGLVKRSDDSGWDGTRWPLLVSLAVGTPWISVAQISPVWATAMIWVMLAGALLALLAVPPGRDRWWIAGPLGLFAGWLTAASFVSLGLLGAGYGVVLGEAGWAWVALAGALATALGILSRVPHAPEYGLGVAWALVAVAVSNFEESTVLALVALAAAAVILWTAAGRLRSR